MIVMEERAWLRRSPGDARVSREDLCPRFDLFAEGHWDTLCDEAVAARERHKRTIEERAMAACRKVQLGEVSRARQCLTGAAPASGNVDTLSELQSKRPREVLRPLPQQIREFHPESPLLELDRDKFLQSLKTAPRVSSPGPGVFSYEHLKIMMDEEDTLELLYEAATSLAQAKVPSSIASALMSARLTALSKKDGGVRGVATGCSLRRLVARALAKQFSSHFEEECAPFQYALSTRAGTDYVGHLLRAATDASPTATVLSVDGIGA